MITQKLPTYFLSHGGGPWPWMKAEYPGKFDKLEMSLREIPDSLPARPRALLIVTSHWIEKSFMLSASQNPEMIYDFGGFPAHTYQVKYPAPGSPEIAAEIHTLLKDADLPAALDSKRGYDHGTYTVAYPMYPGADMPIVQLSIQRGFDPDIHFRVGQALAPLRTRGVLIIGSGLSYHNLGRFGRSAKEPSLEFDLWLRQSLAEAPEIRSERLKQWDQAPSARVAHPAEDHLIPLMVAVGAAEYDPASIIYHEEEFMGGVAVTSFRLG